MRYKSKPSECEATEKPFDPSDIPLPDGVVKEGDEYFVTTIHGQKTKVIAGDYIITEPSDPTKHYPCKPDIFEKRWAKPNGEEQTNRAIKRVIAWRQRTQPEVGAEIYRQDDYWSILYRTDKPIDETGIYIGDDLVVVKSNGQ